MLKVAKLNEIFETISYQKLDKHGQKSTDTSIYNGSPGVLYAIHRYKSMLKAESITRKLFKNDLQNIEYRL